MDNSNENFFESTGDITLLELYKLYGRELTPADIVLKFAEHKNFDAAKEAFQTWDEESVIIMDNFLIQSFRHEIDLYDTRDKYIAVSFLKHLISEWDNNRLELQNARLADPVQQQEAAELLKRRLSGVLPHIDLAGTDFTVDWRLRELRETDEPWKHISFEELEMAESGEEYLCFFNTISHEIYIPQEDILELPENVVVLEIPYELRLDPVAVARDYGMGQTDLLNEYPIQKTLSAKVSSLLESGLPDFVANNLKKLNNSQDNEDHAPKRGR